MPGIDISTVDDTIYAWDLFRLEDQAKVGEVVRFSDGCVVVRVKHAGGLSSTEVYDAIPPKT